MQDYIESYDERAIEIEKTFSYDGYQIVRREMFAHLREPAVTIRSDSITFNTACIEGLEDAVYIHVMVSDDEKRLVIRKCEENDMDSVRWCIAKPDKRKSRTIKGRFSEVIYGMMNWSKGCRYKILGHKITYQGVTLYVFELTQCEIFRERPKRTKKEREERALSMTPEELAEADKLERKQAMTPFSPADVENTFGLPVEEHLNAPQIGTMSNYQGMQEVTERLKSQDGNEDGMPASTNMQGGNLLGNASEHPASDVGSMISSQSISFGIDPINDDESERAREIADYRREKVFPYK